MLITRREFGVVVATSGIALLEPRELLAEQSGKKPEPEPSHSSSGKQHEEHHDPAKPIVHNWDRINAGQPMPQGGAGLQMHPNGDWQCTGNLYNSQAVPCQIALMFGVLSSNGNLYTFQVLDVIGGSLNGGNQLFQWDKHGQSRELKSDWSGITRQHTWTVESLMRLEPPSFGGIGGGGSFSPQLLLSMVEQRLNAVGPVIAVCQ
jgi:hypothetical protein